MYVRDCAKLLFQCAKMNVCVHKRVRASMCVKHDLKDTTEEVGEQKKLTHDDNTQLSFSTHHALLRGVVWYLHNKILVCVCSFSFAWDNNFCEKKCEKRKCFFSSFLRPKS